MFAERRPSDVLMGVASSGLVRHESGILTPMTMTTLQIKSPALVADKKLASESVTNSGLSNGRQGAMLDPFSMPSSIDFPDWSGHDRRASHQAGGANGNDNGSGKSNGNTTIWTTDATTQRTTARSSASSPILNKSLTSDAQTTNKSKTTISMETSASEPLSHHDEASSGRLLEQEEQDLVWNDMPPTLGLDEWAAYIGAMMMKWLASGQSSPRSTMSM
ncbi:hypothetical protein BGZ94_008005 [Podila epigama]|nr:hypothetical protein BGZ94_008005 [Podila epigama]